MKDTTMVLLIILIDLLARFIYHILPRGHIVSLIFGVLFSFGFVGAILALIPTIINNMIRKQMKLNEDLVQDWAWFEGKEKGDGTVDEMKIKVFYEKPEKTSLFGFERGRLINNGVLMVDNMDEEDRRAYQIGGCKVVLVKTKNSGGSWRTRNYLKVKSEDDIFYGNTELYIYAATGRELETWYHSLSRAAEKNVEDDYTEAFVDLLHKLNPYHVQTEPDATWLIGITHSIFYYYHQDPGLLKKLSEEIQSKLFKINLPKSIVSAVLIKDISIGPEIPFIKNVEILDFTSSGNLNLRADATYNGKFYLELEAIIDVNLGIVRKKVPLAIYVTVSKIECILNFFWARHPADRFWIGFQEFPYFDIDIDCYLENESNDFRVPLLSDIIRKVIELEISEKMVYPNMDDAAIPTIGKDKKEKKLKINWEFDPSVKIPRSQTRDSISTEKESSESDFQTEYDIADITKNIEIAKAFEQSLRDSMEELKNDVVDEHITPTTIKPENVQTESNPERPHRRGSDFTGNVNGPPIPNRKDNPRSKSTGYNTPLKLGSKDPLTKEEIIAIVESNPIISKSPPIPNRNIVSTTDIPVDLPTQKPPPIPNRSEKNISNPPIPNRPEMKISNNEEKVERNDAPNNLSVEGPPIPNRPKKDTDAPPIPKRTASQTNMISTENKETDTDDLNIPPPIPDRTENVTNTRSVQGPPLPERTETNGKEKSALMGKISTLKNNLPDFLHSDKKEKKEKKEKDKKEKKEKDKNFHITSIFNDEGSVLNSFKNRLKKRFQDE